MKAKIAVATVSGKAYYLLVNELKKRGIEFLSLVPHETVPLDIKVVITTAAERHLVKHPKVLVYDDESNPDTVANEAFLIIEGKKHYETIVLGVDPGKTFGLAVLSDGNVLETITCSTVDETASMIMEVMEKQQSANWVVKVGRGAPSITAELLPLLDKVLPSDVIIEVVNEAGTSRFVGENIHKRGLRDAFSAIKIAQRRGFQYLRKRRNYPSETRCR
jgi:hypothetical protein